MHLKKSLNGKSVAVKDRFIKLIIFVLNLKEMSSAELNQKKLDLIAWINRLSDENIIEFLDGLKRSKSKDDWWDGLSENRQKMLQNGIDDIEKGNVISSNQFWEALKNA